MNKKKYVVILIIVIAVAALGDFVLGRGNMFRAYGDAFGRNIDDRSMGNGKALPYQKEEVLRVSVEGIHTLELGDLNNHIVVRGSKGGDIEIHYTVKSSKPIDQGAKNGVDGLKMLRTNKQGDVLQLDEEGNNRNNENCFISSPEILVPEGIKVLSLDGYYHYLEVDDFPGTVKLDWFQGDLILNHVGSMEGHVNDGDLQVNGLGEK